MAAGDGKRRIAGKPVAPVDEGNAQRLLREQRPEAGAVEEEIAVYGLAVFQGESGNEAGFRCLQNLFDLAFDAPDPARFGILAQETRIESGIEMVGVAKLGKNRPRVWIGQGELILL